VSEVPRTINISLVGRDPQWVHERLVFERFVAAAGIRVQPDSIRRAVGFDVACETVDGDPLRFELTEAVDRGWASNVGAMTETSRLLLSQLRGGDDHDSGVTRSRYHGWDICVTLVPGAGTRRLRPLVGALFSWLAAHSPEQIGSAALPREFEGTIAKVCATPIRALWANIYCPGAMMWLGDPTSAAIAAKFAKDYPVGIGLQLLVYNYHQPARPDAASNARAYLDANMSDDVFSRVWLYDGHADRVLLKYP
jgi:hypothetical protein